MIDTAIGGMKTRFIKDGKNPTLLILASSKRSEKSFLEEHIKRKLANDHENSLIVDQPVWNVKPKGTYSEKTFRVALGNKFLQSQIIPDDNTEDWTEKGFTVINVPIDFRTDFSDDIDRALCDFAGISSSEINKYISAGAINDVITNKRKNPFTREILEIGNAPDDYAQYYDSFDLSQIPQELKYKPLYIHMDMSISGDKTGIVGTWISGKKTSIDSLSQSKDLYYTVAFAVAIKAPKGRQVSFEKNRNFIYWLKEQGFNIKGITTDTFQSYDTGQALSAKGYNYSILSVDRVTNNICIPYQYLKSTIYEKRIDIFEMNLLRGELIDLERNINTGKVDHPVSCFTGDTKIRLVDGRSVSINDLMIEQEYKQNWVYTFNEQTKKIEPKKIKHVFQSGITKNLVRVTLDNGEVITCTPEHLFMLRDGSYEEIQNLTPGTSLMPLYTKVSDKGLIGYRLYYEPMEDKWHYEHRSFGKPDKINNVIHHCNYNKLDNTPTNLLPVTAEKHRIIHNNQTMDYKKSGQSVSLYHQKMKGTEEYKRRNEKISQSVREYNKQVFESLPEEQKQLKLDKIKEKAAFIEGLEQYFNVDYNKLSIKEKNSYSSKYVRILHPEIIETSAKKVSEAHKQGKFKKIQEVITQKHWVTNGIENKFIFKTEEIPEGYWAGRTISEETKSKIKAANSHANWTEEQRQAYSKLQSELSSNRMWVTNGTEDKYITKNSPIPEGFKLGRCKVGKNHKIVSIEFITKPSRVYDLEIEDNHNFALDAGVIVHNSSKDVADALCGSVYNASLAAEEYAFEYGENMNTAADFNVDVDPISDYINNFEESIKQSHNTQTNYHEGPQEVFIPSSDILFW